MDAQQPSIGMTGMIMIVTIAVPVAKAMERNITVKTINLGHLAQPIKKGLKGAKYISKIRESLKKRPHEQERSAQAAKDGQGVLVVAENNSSHSLLKERRRNIW